MTALQFASLATLVAMFVLTVWRKVNIGLIALPAAYILSLVADVPGKAFMSMFPVKLVMLVIGVTLLFAHVDRSGLLEHSIRTAMRYGGQRTWVVAGICFVIPAALTAAGAYGPASAAIIMPIAYRLSKQAKINYFTLGTATIFGAIGATFSPLSASGALVKSLSAKAGRDYSTGALFILPLIGTAAITAVTLLVVHLLESRACTVRRSAAREALTVEDPDHETVTAQATTTSSAQRGHGEAPTRDSPAGTARHGWSGVMDTDAAIIPERRKHLTSYELACLCTVVGMLIAVFGFNLDVGFVSLAGSLLLFLVFRPPEKDIINAIPWQVVFLISGLLMYIGVLTKIGTLEAMATVLSGIGTPVLTLLALAYLCALMSNVESAAILVLGILVPVALAVFGSSPIALLAALIVVALCSAAPALNPAHIGGALVLASDDPAREPFTFKKLLWHAIAATLIVPGVVTLTVIPLVT
ncbi:SLC13 family permease [Sciscionella marina]|uniref:SLC13 family permease n=1 Tax=Sciscionella marina TaxID=508770 RepID=UPI000366CD47|nr:SLC13 family permease [Sciscionella marina]